METGCLVSSHSGDGSAKYGPGAAALALVGHRSGQEKWLYVAGNKGLAVFDTRKMVVPPESSNSSSGV